MTMGRRPCDSGAFGGVVVSLLHRGGRVQRRCGEEAIFVSPGVFYRIRWKHERRDHREFNLSSNSIYRLNYLLLQFVWLVTPSQTSDVTKSSG